MVGEAIVAGGGSCPCCGQEVKAREVALSAKMGEVVRALVRGYRGGPVTLEAGVALARDAALWDLALPVAGAAFLPTEQARVFMRGELRLPRRLIVWQGRIIGQAGKPTAWGDLKVPPDCMARMDGRRRSRVHSGGLIPAATRSPRSRSVTSRRNDLYSPRHPRPNSRGTTTSGWASWRFAGQGRPSCSTCPWPSRCAPQKRH